MHDWILNFWESCYLPMLDKVGKMNIMMIKNKENKKGEPRKNWERDWGQIRENSKKKEGKEKGRKKGLRKTRERVIERGDG